MSFDTSYRASIKVAMTERQLQRQIFKDHLARCRDRLAAARASVAGKSGLALADAILNMHLRQSEFTRALDFMWESQGRENEVDLFVDPVEYADRMIKKHFGIDSDWDLQNPEWNLDS